jgi:uncharacterized protein (DUF1501 family)
MFTRRSLLTRSALISLTPAVPSFLISAARAAVPDRDRRILVVVQLEGGNDGINTVVPFADENYARHRRALRIAPDRLCKLNDQVGLNPAMRAAANLVEDGRLAIIQGVGYPNPDRSHFRSMAIWQSARRDSREHSGPGWLGRALDRVEPLGIGPQMIHVGPEDPAPALRARRAVATSLADASDLALSLPVSLGGSTEGSRGDDLAAFVSRIVTDAYATATQIEAAAGRGTGSASPYPATELAGRLGLVARMIKAGAGARVYYVIQAGYDTHAAQLAAHAELLREFSGAVKAFLDDLAAAKLAEQVALLAFSEFGRRPAENGSLGTDHGTAGPVFLAGPRIKSGLLGMTPRLGELEEGDLKWSIDFRRIYATLLEGWLGLTSGPALGGSFPPLPLLKA